MTNPLTAVRSALDFYARHHHCMNTTAPNFAREALEVLQQDGWRPSNEFYKNFYKITQPIHQLTGYAKSASSLEGVRQEWIDTIVAKAHEVESAYDALVELIDTAGEPAPQDFTSACCEGERCSMCGEPAKRKVGEEIFHDDPIPYRHNLTAYVCLNHFKQIMDRSGFQRAQPTPEPLDCREAFEARGRKLKWNLFTFHNGEYETLWMQKAWEAWRDCWNQRIATVSKREGV